MKTKLPSMCMFYKYMLAFICLIFNLNVIFAQANPRLTSVNPESNLATVTITNFGDAAVDVSDYWLCLRPGTYRQLSTLNPVGGLNLMPSGMVSVSYNVDVGVANDGLSLYLPNTTTNGGFVEATNVIDFVQWGGAGNIRESLAVTQGLWGSGDFITGSGPYTYLGDGTQNGVAQWSSCDVDGASIQLVGGGTDVSICAGDGTDDFIDVEVVGTGVGTNNGWVITDNATGEILGLPPAPPFNLEGAGAGVCAIWYIRYEDGLTGLSMGADVSALSGCFDLSNPVLVDRSGVDGASIQLVGGGTDVSICAGDGTDDFIDVEVVGTGVGTNNGWVITDNATGEILGLPPAPPFNLEGAGAGVCAIWYIRYEDGLTGLSMGADVSALSGCFDLSNPLLVDRSGVDGASIQLVGGGTDVSICAGDGTDDFIDVEVVGTGVGTNNGWVITDNATGEILGLPPAPPFNLEGAGAGVCAIWYIRYEDGLTGLSMGADVSALSGCFDLSNPVLVDRVSGMDCDLLSISEFDNELAVSVFPNPVKSELFIRINDALSNNVEIQLFNLLGQRVKVGKNVKAEGEIAMNVGDLESGIYVLYIIDEERNSASFKQIMIE